MKSDLDKDPNDFDIPPNPPHQPNPRGTTPWLDEEENTHLNAISETRKFREELAVDGNKKPPPSLWKYFNNGNIPDESVPMPNLLKIGRWTFN